MPAFLTLRPKKAAFRDLLAETGPAVSPLRTPTPNARISHSPHAIKKARIPGRPGRDRPRRFPSPHPQVQRPHFAHSARHKKSPNSSASRPRPATSPASASAQPRISPGTATVGAKLPAGEVCVRLLPGSSHPVARDQVRSASDVPTLYLIAPAKQSPVEFIKLRKDDYSNTTGWMGAGSRVMSKSRPPKRCANSRNAEPSLMRSGGSTTSSKMARISASVVRPCVAARTVSPRRISSGRSWMVMADMSPRLVIGWHHIRGRRPRSIAISSTTPPPWPPRHAASSHPPAYKNTTDRQSSHSPTARYPRTRRCKPAPARPAKSEPKFFASFFQKRCFFLHFGLYEYHVNRCAWLVPPGSVPSEILFQACTHFWKSAKV